MTARANWRDDAACRDADPDLFFPVGTTGPALRQIGEAKRICRTCPAQTQCLAWALDNRVIDGVWGGTTGEERRAMRSPPRRMTAGQQDDDGGEYQPAGHEEQGIRAQAAQGKATRITSGARAGDEPSAATRAKITGDPARRQRFRDLVTSNVTSLGTADLAQAIAGRIHFIGSAGVRDDETGRYPHGGFARDFATADGERVRVEAFTREQFADLVKTTRLARTFAFLERVLDADFCARGGLHTHRTAIGALLAPWFARHTVRELAVAFAETSVPCAHLHNLTG
jgi:WhiB family transcriptional regulator, redox-sensing transcriptional regulator